MNDNKRIKEILTQSKQNDVDEIIKSIKNKEQKKKMYSNKKASVILEKPNPNQKAIDELVEKYQEER